MIDLIVICVLGLIIALCAIIVLSFANEKRNYLVNWPVVNLPRWPQANLPHWKSQSDFLIVESIEEIGTTDDYVYDLETDSGTFYASSEPDYHKKILCKNTDSCYVTFNIQKENYTDENGHYNEIDFMKENFRMSIECAKFVSDKLKWPLNIVFEKIMYPFEIFGKKRYAYYKWTIPEKPSSVEFKGISVVRRDFCNYVKESCTVLYELSLQLRTIKITQTTDYVTLKYEETNAEYNIPKKLMHNVLNNKKLEYFEDNNGELDIKQLCILYTRFTIYNLLILNNIPTEKLYISNSLSGTYKIKGTPVDWNKGYCNKCCSPTSQFESCKGCNECNSKTIFQTNLTKCKECIDKWIEVSKPHVIIAKRLSAKDPVNGPKPPDRITYVYAYKGSNYKTESLKQSEFSYHPSEITDEHKINYLYYFEHQLKTSLDQLFQLLFKTDDFVYIYADIYTKCVNKLSKQNTLSNNVPVSIVQKLKKSIKQESESESESESEPEADTEE